MRLRRRFASLIGMGSRERPIDPRSPHPFRAWRDPGMGAAASGGLGARGTTPWSAFVVTENYLRKSGCAVPGCGRPSDDPIHALPDA